jgi:polar amino acid transport system substrate-binding protein
MQMAGALRNFGIQAERTAADAARRLRRGAFMAATALPACLFSPSAATAQTPFVPDDWKYGKRQESSTLHYCVDARDPDFPVARKIGEAIATALLLQPKEHVVGENVVGESLDSLYQIFLGTCDVHFGFKLIPDAYPDWMKVTRPYYRASYVFATLDAGWRSLADMPRSQAIGSTMGTSADLRLIQYLQALSPAERWSRFPMSSDEAALKALTNGTIGVALVWGPALWALQRNDAGFSKIRLLSPSPLPAASADVGAAVLANESFLRNSVDQAIASLTRDGTIQAILDSNKFPATAVK